MTSNRERFEAWYLAEFWEGSNGGRAMLKKEHCGGYTYAKPQELWKVWQAAQPGAAIDIPAAESVDEPGLACGPLMAYRIAPRVLDVLPGGELVVEAVKTPEVPGAGLLFTDAIMPGGVSES